MSLSAKHEILPRKALPVWSKLPRSHNKGQSWRVQCRVIFALAVREMEADYARFKLGYLWALAEPLFYILPLTIVHLSIRRISASQLHNMSPVLFIVLGVMPWLAFARTMISTYRVVHSNKHLLQLPGITTLDLIAAHGLLKFATYNGLFLLFMSVAVLYEGVWPPRNILAVLLYFNAALALGVSFGTSMIPVHRAFPAVEHFMSLVMRAGFWTAGLFFVVVQVPSWAWPYLTWNPMLHVTELERSAWFPTYDTPVGDPVYVIACILVLSFIGIVSDRALRNDPT